MDRKSFFDAVRPALFDGALSQPQVDGITAILDAAARRGVTDPHHVANILAQVYHETGTYMLPIKETVYASHKDKAPSDATVIARLDRAYAKGQLSWVSSPYWRDGWFGRGPIQLTHKDNYARMGKRLGVDLVSDPSLALDPDIGADIAVVGMSEGMFTGKSLSDYDFPGALDTSVSRNPRRIVNGKDGTDAKIAGYHRQFHDALQASGVGEVIEPPAEPVQPPKPAPRPDPQPKPETPSQEPAVPKKELSPVKQTNKANKGAMASFLSVPGGGIIYLWSLLPSFPEQWASDPQAVVVLTGLSATVFGALGSWAGAYLARDKRFSVD